jgi:hypothetical protein
MRQIGAGGSRWPTMRLIHTREVAGSIPAAPIHTPFGELIWLNHAVRCVREVRDVRRGAPTGAPRGFLQASVGVTE